MLRVIGNFVNCLFAPRLYRTYPNRAGVQHDFQIPTLGEVYETNLAERWGDQMVTYLIPFGTIYCVWQRRFNLLLYLGILIVTSYLLRAAGRAMNPSYLTFLQVLSKAQASFSTENAESLRRYDFQFVHWPVSFTSKRHPAFPQMECLGNGFLTTPCWYIGWLVAHTFGIRLIYPGTLFSFLLRGTLEEGRAKQILIQRGIRTRLATADGNTLDSMFFDHRRDLHPNGKTLVICFEGNAGFYEIGMLNTALDSGYSVLGWNHPGFAGSTGTPYPENEMYAAEAIFDYATTALGFREEDIVLYAWSIGGYTASYLAANHRNIKALLLDATFDDVLPLAKPRMPVFLSSIVTSTIRNHVDLRVNKLLRGYQGPLSLIRRTEDEIIADPPCVLSENRGNFLLEDVMKTRYSSLMNNTTSEKDLRDWLSKPHVNEISSSDVNIPQDVTSLSDKEKARLVVSIASKLLVDFKSSHCAQLPPSLFKIPKEVRQLN